MLEIYLTRHGETEWNIIRRMQGHLDSSLTLLGQKQAEWLGERLEGKGIPLIYTSPLGRAKRTAEIINTYVKGEIIEDDRLKEINLGPWQGKKISEIEKEFPGEHDAFWKNPEAFDYEGIEHHFEVQKRAADFIEEIIMTQGQGKVLVVAHGIILKGMINYLEGKPANEFWSGKHILPTSLTKLTAMGDRLSIVYMSDTSHYEEEPTQGWFWDRDDEDKDEHRVSTR